MTVTQQELRYRGATDEDRLSLLDAVGAYSMLVARDFTRNSVTGKKEWPVGLNNIWNTRFRRLLPRNKFWAPTSNTWAPMMTVDIDEAYDHKAISNFPVTPNWVGINAESGHSQLGFVMADPVYGDGLTRRYYDYIRRRANRTFGVIAGVKEFADKRFPNRLCRNPFDESGEYEWHHQHDNGVTLGELDALLEEFDDVPFVPTPSRRSGGRNVAEITYDSEGLIHRKAYLFDTARFAGYAARSRGEIVEPKPLMQLLVRTGQELTILEPERPVHSETVYRSIARSVERWCNSRLIAGSPGSGEGLMYSLDQCSRGGKRGGATQGAIQGPKNVENGTLARARDAWHESTEAWYRDIRAVRSQNSISETARLLGISEFTVKRACRAGG